MVESWLGEGGYVLPPDGWFRYLRELCDRHGILLVCDEVQSGIGRSGTMWAIEQEGVDARHRHGRQGHRERAAARRDDRPRRRHDAGRPGAHGSTYGGSPVPCAAALATFDVIEDEGLMANASAVGEVFLAGMREIAERHPIVTDVRGRALWIGLSFADHEQAAAVEQASFRRGLLALGVWRRRDPHLAAARVPRGPGARRARDLRGGRRRGRGPALAEAVATSEPRRR